MIKKNQNGPSIENLSKVNYKELPFISTIVTKKHEKFRLALTGFGPMTLKLLVKCPR